MTSISEQTLQAPVQVEIGAQAGVAAPAYTLFDSRAVGLAAFLGSPIAGACLMAHNYRRLGQGAKAAITVMISIAVTGLVILIGWNIPPGASSAIALGLVVGMRSATQSLQGAALKAHVERGGRLGSNWKAFWLGLTFLAVLGGAIFTVAYVQDHGPSITIGTKDQVYYQGTATKEEALALGNALKGGYFEDHGADVLLAKGKDGTTLSFIVKEGSWDQPEMVSLFEVMGQQIGPLVGGYPIRLRLLNKDRDVKLESMIGHVVLAGNDSVYYFGSATSTDAQALGQALKSADYFSGKGADVFFGRHKEGTAISFIVGDGVWNNAAVVADFERIGKQVAPSVGGPPIKLRLVNPMLELKKDEVLR